MIHDSLRAGTYVLVDLTRPLSTRARSLVNDESHHDSSSNEGSRGRNW